MDIKKLLIAFLGAVLSTGIVLLITWALILWPWLSVVILVSVLIAALTAGFYALQI